MKKLIGLILTLTLAASLFAFVGCKNKTSGDDSDNTPGLVYEKVTDDDDNSYFVVTGYNMSEKEADAVADGKYESYMKDLVIPATYTEDNETLPVKEIEDGAFSGQLLFKTVKFEKVDGAYNIEKIGMGAFGGCYNLEKMELPFIGNKVDAVNDKKVFGYIFGASEASNSTSIAQNYNDASETLTVYIPNSLKTVVVDGQETIPAYAFNNVTMLEKVTLSGATKIGNNAFSACTGLTDFVIPDTVTTIGESAFKGCTSLMAVKFPQGEYVIMQEAFRGCTSLGYGNVNANVLEINAKTVYEKAFYGCTSLRAVTIRCDIPAYTFYGCTSLEKVTFLGTASIGVNAFFNCTALKNAYDRNPDTSAYLVNLDTVANYANAFDFNI